MFSKNETGNNMLSDINGKKGTIIGKAVKVEGTLAAKENIRVEGVVDGKIKTDKHLVVGEGAVINADIFATTAFIAGDVKGNVNIKDKLELSNSAKVNGNVKAKIVSMAEGAVLNGEFNMGENNNNNNQYKNKIENKNDKTDEKK